MCATALTCAAPMPAQQPRNNRRPMRTLGHTLQQLQRRRQTLRLGGGGTAARGH